MYVYEVLCFSHNSQLVMDVLLLAYYLNNGSVGPPTIYLGAEIEKDQFKSGRFHWSMPSTHYVNNVVKTVEVLLKYGDRQLRKFKPDGNQPFPNRYCPELEQSNEMISELALSYLQLIGVLHWAVELGNIDIFVEVAVMS